MKAITFVILFAAIGFTLLYLYVMIMAKPVRYKEKANLIQSNEPIKPIIEPIMIGAYIEPIMIGAYIEPITGKLKYYSIQPSKKK